MFSLVIPFHSDYQRVVPTLSILSEQAERWGISEILLCHNGSNLEAFEAIVPYSANHIKVLHTADKGIGAAYRLGIENSSKEFCILSASDLPFGFTDIESFLNQKKEVGTLPELAVGSKLHPRSVISAYPMSRKIYTKLFYITRILLLGRTTPRDSQGTILGSSSLLKRILTEVYSRDYFFSLEILSVSIKRGIKVVELPVKLQNHDQESSVAPIGDGSKMIFRLFELRKRLALKS